MHSFRLLLLVTILFTNSLYAQSGFGPEVGVGMSSMFFVPDAAFHSTSQSSVFSFKAGGIFDVRLNNRVYFQAGLFFARKGHNRDYSFFVSDSLNEYVKQTLNVNYAELPVSVLFKSGRQGGGRIFAGLGVSPAYIIGGRDKIGAHGKVNDTPFTTTINDKIVSGNSLSAFDLGLNFSCGYELPTGLFFRLYYTAGFRDIGLKYEKDKNRMWGISAGYIIGKGRNINHETDDLIDKSD